MSDPEFIESIECQEIAEKLVSKYYPFLGYVNLDLVHFVEMDGYKGKNAPPYIMSGLTQSWARGILQSLGNGKVYCLGVWSDLWEELEQSKKEWIIFRCLYSISPSWMVKFVHSTFKIMALLQNILLDLGLVLIGCRRKVCPLF